MGKDDCGKSFEPSFNSCKILPCFFLHKAEMGRVIVETRALYNRDITCGNCQKGRGGGDHYFAKNANARVKI